MHAQKLQDVAKLPSHQIWRCSKNPTDFTDLPKPPGPSATDLATTLPTDFSSDSTWTRLNLLVLAVCVMLWLPITSLWHQHSEHSERHNSRSNTGSCYCTTKAQQCRLWTPQLSWCECRLMKAGSPERWFYFFFFSWDSATLTPGLVEKIGSECKKTVRGRVSASAGSTNNGLDQSFYKPNHKIFIFCALTSDRSSMDFVAKNWTGIPSK